MFSKIIEYVHQDEQKRQMINLIDNYSDEVICLEDDLKQERIELSYEEIENVHQSDEDGYLEWRRNIECHKIEIDNLESKISHYKNLINKLTNKL